MIGNRVLRVALKRIMTLANVLSMHEACKFNFTKIKGMAIKHDLVLNHLDVL